MFFKREGTNMKLFMVANVQETGRYAKRYSLDKITSLLQAQIENSLEVGWTPENIIILSNVDFEFMGVKTQIAPMTDFCLTGSKIFSLKWYFENNEIKDIIWAKDADCWQNIWFDCPEFDGDVGASQYSNPKFNGGSIFWKPSSKDIISRIVQELTENSEVSEEPTINKIFKSKEYINRVNILNYTFNVGCSGFFERFTRSEKPIHVSHFHPSNSIAWEIHALDREGIGQIAITVRLERLLRKYYPKLATSLVTSPELLKELRKVRKELKKKEWEELQKLDSQKLDSQKLESQNLLKNPTNINQDILQN